MYRHDVVEQLVVCKGCRKDIGTSVLPGAACGWLGSLFLVRLGCQYRR
jgi:hypothetical protein